MKDNKNVRILKKMLYYCYDARKYAIDKSYDDFISDERSLVFSVFSLSQLGELVSVLEKTVLEKYNEIPWNALKSIRNRIVHDYEGVRYRIIWNVIQNELPVLEVNLQKIIAILNQKGDF